MKFGIWGFSEIPSREFKFHYNLTRIVGTLHEYLCAFMVISRRIILKMINISHESCRKNRTTNRKSCRLWDNVEKHCSARQATSNSIIRRMRFALWIPNATNTHLEYDEITAFRRQQWLRERTWMPHCSYITCLGNVITGGVYCERCTVTFTAFTWNHALFYLNPTQKFPTLPILFYFIIWE
jgi:hypothetical protein